jgi:hypothetical protein
MSEGETADVRFSDSRITNKNDLLGIDELVFSLRRSCAYPRTRTLNKKSKELLRSPMVATVEGRCADAVPSPPGFVDRLFVLVLFPHS